MNKIMHIHWGFPPIIGGVETHLTILLPEFVRRGHEVSLLTGAVDGTPSTYKYDGVDIHRTPLLDLNWLAKRGVKGIREELSKYYREKIDAIKPDLIHTHNMHYFSEPHAIELEKLCKEKGIPMLLTAHNVWDDMQFLELTRKISWDHIIAVSHYIRMELLGIGIDDQKTSTIHHGLNTSNYPPRASEIDSFRYTKQLKEKRVIFHPARMGLAKGNDVVIKAFPKILESHPDTLLVLAGTKNIIDWALAQEKEIAYFLALIKSLGIEDHVLIDAYALHEMPILYELSDLVVYPSSQAEPFGLTILEAFAASKPIIVTNMGGMPEIVQDQISGFVIPHRNIEALSNRAISLLSDERLRKRIGRTGREIVEKNYTGEVMTTSHLKLYEQLLNAKLVSGRSS